MAGDLAGSVLDPTIAAIAALLLPLSDWASGEAVGLGDAASAVSVKLCGLGL